MSVTGQDLYNQHRVEVADAGTEIPPWANVPEWEREEWEKLAQEQNLKQDYQGGDFDD